MNTKDVKIVPGDRSDWNVIEIYGSAVGVGNGDANGSVSGCCEDSGEHILVVAKVAIHGKRNQSLSFDGKVDQFVRPGNRQGSITNGIDEREHRSIRTDSQSQRKYRHCGKAG